VTPENRDMNRLFVRSVDRAGNLGLAATYQFLAGRGTDPIGQWNLDEKSGNVLADASGKGRPATLSGGTSFTDSRVGGGNGAVGFNGGDGQAVTGKPVIAPGTNFSVAAGCGSTPMAASRRGRPGRQQSLWDVFAVRTVKDRWSFTVTAGDVDNRPVPRWSPMSCRGWGVDASGRNVRRGETRWPGCM